MSAQLLLALPIKAASYSELAWSVNLQLISYVPNLAEQSRIQLYAMT